MGSPVVSSVPNSQTGLGLLATEPIETELSAGIGLGEVVHDEPWLKTDRKMLARINKLLEDVRRDPFTGIGKPEPLKYHLPEPGHDESTTSTASSTSSPKQR